MGRVENYRTREALPSRRNVLRSTCVEVTSVCTALCLSVSPSAQLAIVSLRSCCVHKKVVNAYWPIPAGLVVTQTELLVSRVTRSGRSRLSFNPVLLGPYSVIQ
jgi:hypothetical protein